MIFLNGYTNGQLVINTSNSSAASPAIWSDVGSTLNATDITTAQTTGIRVESGGYLEITNLSTPSTYIDGSIVLLNGGDLKIINVSNLYIDEGFNIDGSCLIQNGSVNVYSISGPEVTFGVNADLKLQTAGLNLYPAVAQFLVENGAKIDMTSSTLHSRSPVNIISGFIDVSNNSIIRFEKLVQFSGSSSTAAPTMLQSIGSQMNFDLGGEVIFSGTYEFDCDNTIIRFSGDFDLGSSNKITCTNSPSFRLGDVSKTVLIRGDLDISGSISHLWGSDIDLYGKLILNGTTFSLYNRITMHENSLLESKNDIFKMDQDAEIDLSATCSSIIRAENTVFKPLISGETWKGIRANINVLCNSITSSQYLQAPQIDNNGNCDNVDWAGLLNDEVSLIELTDCAFENAEIAIDADGRYGFVGNVDYRGATIVRARETTFTNCQQGIRIKDYFNSNGDPNASYIMTCNFITDNAYPFPNKQDLTHIELNNLGESGINIGGCIFTNFINMPEQDAERGTGIKIYKASVSIDQDGDRCKLVEGNECPGNGFADPLQSRNNEFHNLSYGVRVDQDAKSDYSASIRFSDFYDCYRSIDVTDAENTPINENNFTLTQSTYASYFANPNPGDRYFINLTECGGYTVADCKMYAHLDVAADEITYIQATNATGLPVYNSKIKENEFHNNNAIGISNGIVLQDHSRGNDISCNDFFALTTDIWVKGSSSTHIEQIPKGGETHSRNEYSSSSGNLSFVANVSSTVSLIDYIPNAALSSPPIYAGMASLSGDDDAPNCDFVCEDNENTTTASDDEVLGVLKIAGNTNLWIYEENVNSIAFGTSDKKVYDICIYNLYGQCGVELENVYPKTSIDVSSLSNGIYFVSLRDSEGIETTLKFIKK